MGVFGHCKSCCAISSKPGKTLKVVFSKYHNKTFEKPGIWPLNTFNVSDFDAIFVYRYLLLLMVEMKCENRGQEKRKKNYKWYLLWILSLPDHSLKFKNLRIKPKTNQRKHRGYTQTPEKKTKKKEWQKQWSHKEVVIFLEANRM